MDIVDCLKKCALSPIREHAIQIKPMCLRTELSTEIIDLGGCEAIVLWLNFCFGINPYIGKLTNLLVNGLTKGKIMSHYQKILVALALDPSCDDKIIQTAKEMGAQFGGEITLIHAVEHMANYGAAYGVSVGIDIEEQMRNEAIKEMQKVGAKNNITKEHCIVKMGSAKHIILEEAEKHKMDLILVGSHGRHGVRLLLGSTANAVLHNAKCDVLAIRVED